MTPKQIRERKFAIMKQRSHPNAQPRDIYQEAHLRNTERNHNLMAAHTMEMEVYARCHAKALDAIAAALAVGK